MSSDSNLEATSENGLPMKLAKLWLIGLLIAACPTLKCQGKPETSSLSCWQGKSFRTRTAKTDVRRSDAGYAYAEVRATAVVSGKSQLCGNRVRLYYSNDGRDYKVVYEDHRDMDGLGISILGWSKKGDELLFQTTEWPYESDFYTLNRAFLYHPKSRMVQDLHVADAVARVFGPDCEFDEAVVGWHSDESLLVRVTKTPFADSYDQVFCVQKPTRFLFGLEKRSMSRLDSQ